MRKFMACAGIMALLAGMVLTGCARAPKMTPEEEIQSTLNTWRSAMATKDLDAIMALFSENFQHFNWRDKEGARQFIQEAIDAGQLDGIEVLLEDAEITVEDQSASVFPVDLMGSFGSLTMELMLAREDGKWLFVGMDAPGL